MTFYTGRTDGRTDGQTNDRQTRRAAYNKMQIYLFAIGNGVVILKKNHAFFCQTENKKEVIFAELLKLFGHKHWTGFTDFVRLF